MAFKGKARVSGASRLRQRLTDLGIGISRFSRSSEVRDTLVDLAKKRFDTKKDPQGRRWKSLVTGTFTRGLRRNTDLGDIGVDTGLLRDSIAVIRGNSGPTVFNTGAGFRIGVKGKARRYAATFQQGGKSPLTGGRVPGRRFLGVGFEENKAVERLAQEMIDKRLGG